jgi:ribosomal protein S18 acetylase RimI-like enzyme
MSLNYLNVVIRQAKTFDAEALVRAEREITLNPGHMILQPHEIDDGQCRDKIEQLSDHPRGVYLVAEIDKAVIGHAVLDPQKLEAIQHVALMMTAVHPGHQGHGIGQKLTTALIEWAKSRTPLEKIELQVRSTNAPALSLYKKVGFQEEGRRLRRVKLADDQYIDDVLMGLWL